MQGSCVLECRDECHRRCEKKTHMMKTHGTVKEFRSWTLVMKVYLNAKTCMRMNIDWNDRVCSSDYYKITIVRLFVCIRRDLSRGKLSSGGLHGKVAALLCPEFPILRSEF